MTKPHTWGQWTSLRGQCRILFRLANLQALVEEVGYQTKARGEASDEKSPSRLSDRPDWLTKGRSHLTRRRTGASKGKR